VCLPYTPDLLCYLLCIYHIHPPLCVCYITQPCSINSFGGIPHTANLFSLVYQAIYLCPVNSCSIPCAPGRFFFSALITLLCRQYNIHQTYYFLVLIYSPVYHIRWILLQFYLHFCAHHIYIRRNPFLIKTISTKWNIFLFCKFVFVYHKHVAELHLLIFINYHI
jgi:hypothetical protein